MAFQGQTKQTVTCQVLGFFGGREGERKTLFVSLPVPARILSLEILVTLGLKENIGVPLAACSLTPDDAVRTNFGCN